MHPQPLVGLAPVLVLASALTLALNRIKTRLTACKPHWQVHLLQVVTPNSHLSQRLFRQHSQLLRLSHQQFRLSYLAWQVHLFQ